MPAGGWVIWDLGWMAVGKQPLTMEREVEQVLNQKWVAFWGPF